MSQIYATRRRYKKGTGGGVNPVASTRFGVSLGDNTYAQQQAKFSAGTSPLPFVRIFQTNDLVLTNPAILAANQPVLLSFKGVGNVNGQGNTHMVDGDFDAGITTFCRNYTAGEELILCFNHEPEGGGGGSSDGWTATTFSAAADHFCALIKNMTGVTANIKSAVIFMAGSMTAAQPHGDMHGWMPTTNLPDYIGFDYDGNTDDEYTTYTNIKVAAKAFCAGYGKPQIAPEFAHAFTSTDADHSDRAAWLTSMSQGFIDDGLAVVCYWDQGDSVLTEANEINVWADLMGFQGSNPGGGNAVVPVSVWRTGGPTDKRFALQAAFNTAQYDSSAPGTYPINITATTHKHRISGWGAAITQSTAAVLMGMSATNLADFLQEKFDPVTGVVSSIRICFGSSDYEFADGSVFTKSKDDWSVNIYTYDDMPSGQTDPDFSNFSIGSNGATKTKDYKYIIPLLKKILAINPNIEIMATIWSLPRWMKTGLAKAAPNNSGGTVPTGNRTAAGKYAQLCLEAYAAIGITVKYLSIQNEPTTDNNWAYTKYITGADAIPIYKTTITALASSTVQSVKDTIIMVLDNGLNRDSWVRACYADATVLAGVGGTAFHTYAPGVTTSVISGLRTDFPSKSCWITEGAPGKEATIEGNPDNGGGGLVATMARFWVGSTRDGSRGTVYWNLVLDQYTGPYYTRSYNTEQTGGTNFPVNGGGFSQPAYTIQTTGSTKDRVTNNMLHFALNHMAKVMKPGAWVVPATDYKGDGYLVKPDDPTPDPMTGWDVVACVNGDGSRGLVITGNPNNPGSRTFRVHDGNKMFDLVVNVNEVVSASWSGS